MGVIVIGLYSEGEELGVMPFDNAVTLPVLQHKEKLSRFMNFP